MGTIAGGNGEARNGREGTDKGTKHKVSIRKKRKEVTAER